MRVLVLGAGVIGVATAWYLAEAGCEVTVVDRQPGPGRETSFANAGEVSPGYSSPWAGPGVPLKAVKWMLAEHPPLIIRPQADPAQWRFMALMAANCTEARYAANKDRMLRLAEYSRDLLRDLRLATAISYDEGTRGTVQLFRTAGQMASIRRDTAILERQGVRFRTLDVEGCLEREPALAAVRDRIVGGLWLPGDETGDCFTFTEGLAVMAARRGVRFQPGVAVERLVREGGRIVAVETNAGDLTADAYVLALGSYSPALLRPLGLELPVYPVKGYSLTIPVADAEAAPVSTVMDEAHKVAITRLGDRIRVAGMAELAGFDLSLPERRRATLAHVVGDLFPRGGRVAEARFWCGLRPMLPDGGPAIGAVPDAANLWVNTGHGTLGWTMACGSGKLLADLVTGTRPAIDATAHRPDRRWF
ncbi:MAG TPA: D-amino acid dehydrogenase [Azospirillaceae bacterium]|nr:D-amino acid dehydrogenase [Azospirillaceae bacterium]